MACWITHQCWNPLFFSYIRGQGQDDLTSPQQIIEPWNVFPYFWFAGSFRVIMLLKYQPCKKGIYFSVTPELSEYVCFRDITWMCKYLNDSVEMYPNFKYNGLRLFENCFPKSWQTAWKKKLKNWSTHWWLHYYRIEASPQTSGCGATSGTCLFSVFWILVLTYFHTQINLGGQEQNSDWSKESPKALWEIK